ncbi:hypothetical protein A6452_15045 [Bradyrhizobium elkanii]|nr:hypothetical protein A6452_15045 [Bradyrhizobium elkanii]
MEGNRASRPQMSDRCADQRDRVALVHQDIATDSQVAISRTNHFGGIAFHELDICVTSGARPVARHCDRSSIAIDRDDGSGRSDNFRREHGHIPCSATEVDDSHAWSQPDLA